MLRIFVLIMILSPALSFSKEDEMSVLDGKFVIEHFVGEVLYGEVCKYDTLDYSGCKFDSSRKPDKIIENENKTIARFMLPYFCGKNVDKYSECGYYKETVNDKKEADKILFYYVDERHEVGNHKKKKKIKGWIKAIEIDGKIKPLVKSVQIVKTQNPFFFIEKSFCLTPKKSSRGSDGYVLSSDMDLFYEYDYSYDIRIDYASNNKLNKCSDYNKVIEGDELRRVSEPSKVLVSSIYPYEVDEMHIISIERSKGFGWTMIAYMELVESLYQCRKDRKFKNDKYVKNLISKDKKFIEEIFSDSDFRRLFGKKSDNIDCSKNLEFVKKFNDWLEVLTRPALKGRDTPEETIKSLIVRLESGKFEEASDYFLKDEKELMLDLDKGSDGNWSKESLERILYKLKNCKEKETLSDESYVDFSLCGKAGGHIRVQQIGRNWYISYI